MKYSIGQILTLKEETVIEKSLSGNKVTISKGNQIIIGVDNLAHHIRNGYVQPLPKDSEVNGYSTEGLAEWIYIYMRNHLPLDEMLESYDESRDSFKENIVDALEEIGFYE